MVEHVYRRAAEARGVDAVVVATDDERIANAVETFGGVVRLTRPGHRTGTDRVAETARDLRCEIIVNVQADLPLIEPEMIAEVITPLSDDSGVQMSTLRQAITNATDYDNPNVVKVVFLPRQDPLLPRRRHLLQAYWPVLFPPRLPADVRGTAADTARARRVARAAARARARLPHSSRRDPI